MLKLPVRPALALAVLIAVGALAGAAPAAQEPTAVPAGGTFVIGDGNAVVGAHVEFWGAQWWKLNTVSGGEAPADFKGFAQLPADPTCDPFSTEPGNSPPPPDGPLPGLITVLVTDSVSLSGSTISGTVTNLALVATDPGYGSDPGHEGTGVVVALLGCPSF